MSVLIIGKFKGDTAKFQQALVDRADEFAKLSEESKAAGGLHHRFGIGDGYVLIVDEWESVEHFQNFMANPDLPERFRLHALALRQTVQVSLYRS